MLEGTAPVLMTEYQPYGVRHFLRESEAEGASELRRRLVPLADGTSLEKGLWADTDDFRADAFEPYEALVLRRSPEQSRPPGDFELAWSGEFYEVWERGAGATRRADGTWDPAARPSPSRIAPTSASWRPRLPGGTLRAATGEEPTFLAGTSGRIRQAAAGELHGLARGLGSRDGEAFHRRHRGRIGPPPAQQRGALRGAWHCRAAGGRARGLGRALGPDLAPGSGGPGDEGGLAITRSDRRRGAAHGGSGRRRRAPVRPGVGLDRGGALRLSPRWLARPR